MNRAQLITYLKSVIYPNSANAVDAGKHQALEIQMLNDVMVKSDDILTDSSQAGDDSTVFSSKATKALVTDEASARQTADNGLAQAISDLTTALSVVQNWKAAMTTADADSIINTLTELLDLAKNMPEGADLAALLTAKVSTSDIVNNLTSVLTNAPLSAYQGKILNDAIKTINDSLAVVSLYNPSTNSISVDFLYNVITSPNSGTSDIVINSYSNLPTAGDRCLIVQNLRTSCFNITLDPSTITQNNVNFNFYIVNNKAIQLQPGKTVKIDYKFVNRSGSVDVYITYSISKTAYSGEIATTGTITHDLQFDTYRVTDSGSSALALTTFTNLPLPLLNQQDEKLLIISNTYTAAKPVAFRTANLVVNGITYSFINLDASLSIPASKQAEISYLFIRTGATTVEMRVSAKIMA